ncbi:Uncharacterized protein APZ42_019043 [Daphnia magna]|uniref:Uncharacterized protein n=1 Tax=Daphnia magna TaxID=35525 RepID=A0A164YLN2_9CRUS|nr:Uncharacterized protein APZ42_019043 [Daphnia magna]
MTITIQFNQPQSLHLLCVANHQPSASQVSRFPSFSDSQPSSIHFSSSLWLLFLSSSSTECQHGIRFIFCVTMTATMDRL